MSSLPEETSPVKANVAIGPVGRKDPLLAAVGSFRPSTDLGAICADLARDLVTASWPPTEDAWAIRQCYRKYAAKSTSWVWGNDRLYAAYLRKAEPIAAELRGLRARYAIAIASGPSWRLSIWVFCVASLVFSKGSIWLPGLFGLCLYNLAGAPVARAVYRREIRRRYAAEFQKVLEHANSVGDELEPVALDEAE